MRKFKTESQKLLDLMINSIYTNQEIFLRELISNASDAVDKLHFISLTDKNLDFSKESFEIFVSYNKDDRTITVTDNGVGMTKDELDKNLGTIAHSDSMDFKNDNSENQGDDVDIIGQFGVGFYSVFMVSKKVEVISKSYKDNSDSYIWKSDGIKGYEIVPGNRKNRGTEVILYLKDDTKDCNYSRFLDEYELTELIKRFSNYVRYPIKMETTQRKEKPKPKDAGDDYTPEYEEYKEIQTINSMVPIWKQKKSQVKKEDYNEFYKNNFHDYSDPQLYFDIHAEGTLNYDALIFIPSQAPMDLYTKEYKKGLQLYTSNVMIMEKCEELVPDYYNFVKGVVDSPDLTLNISRETLQHNSQLQAIARRIEKRIKKELIKMLDKHRDDYEKFFNNFGRVLKFGIYSSYGAKKDELADLLIFYSAKQEKLVTLKEYIKDAADKPKYIYYAAGKDKNQILKMPALTTLLSKGFDVLVLSDDIDEFCISSMFNYDDIEFKNISSGDLDIDTEDEKKETEKIADSNKDLLEAMKKALPDEVSKVTISNRVTDAPACISAEGPMSFEMERVMSGMPNTENDASIGGMQAQRVLELNPKHDVFNALKSAQKNKDNNKIKQYAQILYDQALLVEGLPIKDPVEYGKNIAKLMK